MSVALVERVLLTAGREMPKVGIAKSATKGVVTMQSLSRPVSNRTAGARSSDVEQPSRLWSIRDVAEYLGVPAGTIYQWRVRGEGPPGMRMGKHLRFDPESVARWAHGLEEDGDGRRHP
jgi:excisionase family DNA binding protein